VGVCDANSGSRGYAVDPLRVTLSLRRLGEMMKEQPRAGVGKNKRFSENPLKPTLASTGKPRSSKESCAKL
jgi:hypothetical protein